MALRSPKHVERNSLAVVAAALAFALSLGVGVASAVAPTWHVVPAIDTDPTVNVLTDVDRIPGTRLLWAVGYDRSSSAIIEQWDGTQWNLYPTPSANDSILQSVVALSATNAWSVGNYAGPTSNLTLIEHWDGTRWSIVPSPNPGAYGALSGVAALSANNVWAAGGSGYGPLIEHWDGSTWQIALDDDWGGGGLVGLGRVPGTKQLWAAGGINGTVLYEHYVKGSWHLVSGPPGAISSVAAVSSQDVWAVGVSVAVPRRTLIEHWNGIQWSVVPSPNVSTEGNVLNAVARVPKSATVWAVGYYYPTTGDYQTLTMKWTGSVWVVIPSPTSKTGASNLLSVTALAQRNVWAVGTRTDPASYHVLTAHYSP
jgi:hypothetical protein